MLKKQKNITNISFLNNMIIPILSAISVRNEKLSKILINKRININHSTDIELSPYHFVSYYNIPKQIQSLLKKSVYNSNNSKTKRINPFVFTFRNGNF